MLHPWNFLKLVVKQTSVDLQIAHIHVVSSKETTSVTLKKKERGLAGHSAGRCLLISKCLSCEGGGDNALWCPWNLMVSQLTRFPAIGFMSDVPSLFCRRRECDSFYPPRWCGVLSEIRTVKVLRDTVIIDCDGLHHSSSFIICAAPSSPPILLFFGWTLGGAAKAKTLAPSNPSVC